MKQRLETHFKNISGTKGWFFKKINKFGKLFFSKINKFKLFKNIKEDVRSVIKEQDTIKINKALFKRPHRIF